MKKVIRGVSVLIMASMLGGCIMATDVTPGYDYNNYYGPYDYNYPPYYYYPAGYDYDYYYPSYSFGFYF